MNLGRCTALARNHPLHVIVLLLEDRCLLHFLEVLLALLLLWGETPEFAELLGRNSTLVWDHTRRETFLLNGAAWGWSDQSGWLLLGC